MNLLHLSAKSLLSKPAGSGISLLLLSLGVGIISLLFLLTSQLEDKFQRNISGIDLVAGAKGSPLQIILSAVFQIDNPTGNISLHEALKLSRNRLVSKAIPLAYGDSYQGFRLVGSSNEYPELYNATLQEGRIWSELFEVTIGSRVAQQTGLKTGDTFLSAHGLIEGAGEHDDHPFRVAGVFAPGNSVLDGLIVTSLESVWAVHEHETDEHDNDAVQQDSVRVGADESLQEKEITAILIKFKGPMGMVMLPRQINQNSNMQAAVPALEITRLFQLLGIGTNLLKSIAFAIILIAGFSFFLSLYNSLRQRKYELALMRSMGGSSVKIFSLLLIEGILLSIVGYIIGIVLGHGGLWAISNYSESSFGYQFDPFVLTLEEVILAGAVLLLGVIASVIPAIKAIKTPIADTLSGS